MTPRCRRKNIIINNRESGTEDHKMGKGNRNKQARAQDRMDNPEAYLDERKRSQSNNHSNGAKSGKNKTGMSVAVVVALILVCVIIIGAFAAAFMNSAGIFLRATDAISTENFEVDGAMMNFFFNDYIMNWYSQNALYVQYGMISVNFALNLKNQAIGSGYYDSALCGGFEGTWYDYFLAQTAEELTIYLEYAEGAKAAGIELTEEDKSEIDTVMENLNASIKEANASYSTWYGPGVKEKDVRRCYELIYLAARFNDVKVEELQAALDKEEDVVKKYPDEHKEDFYFAEYLSYTITEKSSDYENDEQFNNAVTKAKENAEKIAAAKTPEEFFELVQTYEETVEEEEESDTSETESSTKEETTTAEPTIDDYKGSISYGTSSDLEKWIFEEAASENDVKVLEEEKTEEVTESGSSEKKTVTTKKVTVYLVTNPSSLDYDITRDLGYILTSDKAVAESILNDFKAGTMSADALSDLGQAKYESLGEDSKTELYFNSLEGVAPGYFEQYSYGPVDEWLNTEGLKEGSCSDVIEIKPSTKDGTTYYAICYYEKDNKEVWYLGAYNSIISERFDEWYQGADGKGGQLAKTPITKNNKVLNDLHVITFGGSTTTN